jgi:ribokinase
MPKFDIISIGGATVDIFVKPQKCQILRMSDEGSGGSSSLLCFNYGGKLQVEDVHETFGGGAANTSVGFHRLGLCSAIATLVGNDEWGQRVINNLKQEGVATNLIQKSRSSKSSFSVIVSSYEGERTVLFYPGANKKLTKTHLSEQHLKNTKWIFLNRVSSENEDVLKHLTDIITRHPQLKVAWNPGGKQINETYLQYKKLLKRVNILFLNKEEGAIFSKKNFQKQNSKNHYLYLNKKHPEQILPEYAYDVVDICQTLKKTGVKNIVITDGKRGAQSFDGKYLYFCPIDSLQRKDTLGAGDSFCTGFTYGYLLGVSLHECLKFATINATSVVNFYGAQTGLLTKRQMQDQFEKTQLKTTKINITKK